MGKRRNSGGQDGRTVNGQDEGINSGKTIVINKVLCFIQSFSHIEQDYIRYLCYQLFCKSSLKKARKEVARLSNNHTVSRDLVDQICELLQRNSETHTFVAADLKEFSGFERYIRSMFYIGEDGTSSYRTSVDEVDNEDPDSHSEVGDLLVGHRDDSEFDRDEKRATNCPQMFRVKISEEMIVKDEAGEQQLITSSPCSDDGSGDGFVEDPESVKPAESSIFMESDSLKFSRLEKSVYSTTVHVCGEGFTASLDEVDNESPDLDLDSIGPCDDNIQSMPKITSTTHILRKENTITLDDTEELPSDSASPLPIDELDIAHQGITLEDSETVYYDETDNVNAVDDDDTMSYSSTNALHSTSSIVSLHSDDLHLSSREIQERFCKIRQQLNRLRHNSVTNEVIRIMLLDMRGNEHLLHRLVRLIFAKVLQTPDNGVYASLCKRLRGMMVGNVEGNQTFRELLLSECEKEIHKTRLNRTNWKFRRDNFINFLAELFAIRMITWSLLDKCLTRLLNYEMHRDENELICFCRLFKSSSKNITVISSAVPSRVRAYFRIVRELLRKTDLSYVVQVEFEGLVNKFDDGFDVFED